MEYLFSAYTVTWILIFGYTVTIGRRQKRLAAELEHLQRAIEKSKKY